MRQLQHKQSGWIRAHESGDVWRIIPTDGTPERRIAMLSAYTWQNHPNDSRARSHEDRVVLIEGAELPDWAVAWLEAANRAACVRARRALRDAIAQADWDEDRRGGL